MEPVLFDRARAYEDTYWWFRARRDILLAVVQKQAPKGAWILDVGCCTGFISQAMREHFHVASIDFAPEALVHCAQKGLPAARASIQQLPYRDGMFDLVTCFDVLYHRSVWPIETALKEISRVLKPGGVIVTAEPAYQWLYGDMDILDHARKRFTARELGTFLSDSGFTIQTKGYFNTYLAPIIIGTRLSRRLRNALISKRDPVVEFGALPNWLNMILTAIFQAETKHVLRGGFSFGTSVICVGKK